MLKYGLVLSFVVAAALAVTCPPQGVYKTKSPSGCRDYIKCNFGKQTVETCSTFLKAFDPVNMKCDYCWRVNCSAPAAPWPTQPPTEAPTKPTKPTAAPATPTGPTTKPTAAPATAPTGPTTKPTAAPATAPTSSTTKPTAGPATAPTGPTIKPTGPTTKITSTAKVVSNMNNDSKEMKTTPKPLNWWGKIKHFFGA